jgi:FkbM family methyltransferase
MRWLRFFDPRNLPHYARMISDPIEWRRAAVHRRLFNRKPLAYVEIDGCRFLVDLRARGGLARRLFVTRQFEPAETAFLHSAVRPGMTAVDAGANIGFITINLAKAVTTQGRVVAFEPEPNNFFHLSHNVSNNGHANVTAINAAVGDHCGSVELCKSSENFGDHRLNQEQLANDEVHSERVSVRMTTIDDTLDELGISSVQFLKMDIQGYEVYAHRGMKRMMQRSPDIVVMTEYWPKGLRSAGTSPEEFLEFFEAHKLSAHVINERGDVTEVSYSRLREALPGIPNETTRSYTNLVFRRSP